MKTGGEILKGWVTRLGEEEYFHRFGGESWRVVDPKLRLFVPTLLLVLDLRDPRLAALRVEGTLELPLCSHINCSVWSGKQVFQIDPNSRTVVLVEREINEVIELWETGFPNPLPEKRLKLYPMQDSDYYVTEEQYWEAVENFLNGTSFVRVLGSPLWIDCVLTEEEEHSPCEECGLPMQYVCAIGQQSDFSEKYVEGEPFYIGEGVSYFFVCRECLRLTVIFQST